MVTRNILVAVATAAVMLGAAGLSIPTAAADTGATQGCIDLGGTVGSAQTCRIHTETGTYTSDVSYPLDYPDQQSLTDFLATDRDNFVDFVAESRVREWPYGHDLTAHPYRSEVGAKGTQTVVLEIYDDTGAHPVTAFKAFNYDLGAHAPITFDTLFDTGADPAAVLDPIVQRFMDSRWKGYGGPAPSNTLGAKVYQNFAVTDDAVIFFIGQGMWLPEVAGPLEVSVPRSEIATLLA
jgi:Protein of unknown function (DUF3298)